MSRQICLEASVDITARDFFIFHLYFIFHFFYNVMQSRMINVYSLTLVSIGVIFIIIL